MSKTIYYDLEVFKNYFVACFLEGDEFFVFELQDIKGLLDYISDKEKILVGFNSLAFDDLLLKALWANSRTKDANSLNTHRVIKNMSDSLILDERSSMTKYRWFPSPWGESRDTFQMAPLMGGLKKRLALYGFPLIQDLPFSPDTEITETDKADVIEYCKNDVLGTKFLFEKYADLFLFRQRLNDKYGIYVTNKSSGGVCEAYFKKHLGAGRPAPNNTPLVVAEMIPDWLSFSNPEVQTHLDYCKGLVAGYATLRKKIGKTFKVYGTNIKMAAGGLHSKDKSLFFKKQDGESVIDIDVQSFYPNVMRSCQLAPRHMDKEKFFAVYDRLINDRISAKKSGDRYLNEGLKIVINSTYGKTNNEYSILYDPFVQLAVILVGQFALFKLAEMLHCEFKVLSLNTDGVTVALNDCDLEKFRATYKEWEELTGLVLEEANFELYARRDVNNYIARGATGDVKEKGVFLPLRFGQSPFVGKALTSYFLRGRSLDEMCLENWVLTDFLIVFHATSQFTISHGGKDVQATCRWYVSTKSTDSLVKYGPMTKSQIKKWKEKNPGEVHPEGFIRRIKIPNGNNAVIVNLLETTELPDDLDYDYYLTQVRNIIEVIENGKV